jgi:aminocarboxymuconate-semialdehyde decarboxylase
MPVIVDMHNHGLSPGALARLCADQERLGLRVVDKAEGVELHFRDGFRQTVLPRWTDLDERLRHLRAQGVDGAVLSNQVDFCRYTLPPDDGLALCRVLNDGMAEWVAGRGEVRGMATVPLQDGAKAAAELERATALGLRGAMITTHVGPHNLDLPDLEPFWAAAEALRAPIFIHPSDVLGKERLSCYYTQNLLGNPFETTVAATHLVMSGVLDRHPELTVVLAHGGGYFTLAYGRLSHGYGHVPNVSFPSAKPPAAYVRRFFYDTLLYDAEALRHLVRVAGVDRILLGSDYPFVMEPDHLLELVDSLELPAKERDRLLGNAARLYGF